eukprot:scaffold17623_cov65-Phaeocystis_antarctica.AAC.1
MGDLRFTKTRRSAVARRGRIQRCLSAESALQAGGRNAAASRSPQLRRCSCDQLGLDCGYAGPTIAGVEAAGAKSS